jgi:hypothetical protein
MSGNASGNASVRFPPDGSEKTWGGTSEGLADDPSADELVARAFAILAEEQERWRSARSEGLHPWSSS